MCVKSDVNLTRNLRDMSLKIETRVSCWYRIFQVFKNFILKHPISKLKVWEP